VVGVWARKGVDWQWWVAVADGMVGRIEVGWRLGEERADRGWWVAVADRMICGIDWQN